MLQDLAYYVGLFVLAKFGLSALIAVLQFFLRAPRKVREGCVRAARSKLSELHTIHNPPSDLRARARTLQLMKNFGEWAVVTGATDGIGKAYAQQVSPQVPPGVLRFWQACKRPDVAMWRARLHLAAAAGRRPSSPFCSPVVDTWLYP